MWQFWLIASGVFLILEIFTLGFLVFWLAIGALFAMIVSFITDSIFIQTIVFVISSIILIFATKPFVKKLQSKDVSKTNVYSIIGKKGIVIEDIDSTDGKGQIKCSGEIWSAKSIDHSIIPKGTKIQIEKIEGVKAYVKPLNNN